MDIESPANERDPATLHLEDIGYAAIPRLDLAYANDFFPNLRCMGPCEACILCSAFLLVSRIDEWYSQACVNLDWVEFLLKS